jgi:hypothetical protein
MSSASPRYFHAAELRQRFVDQLDEALHAGRLGSRDQLWLKSLIRQPVADDPDPVRVDRISLGDDSLEPLALSSTLLLSHSNSTDDTSIYLYTLTGGFEVFADRHLLSSALRTRFADGDATALFEQEKIEGDVFNALMLAIVDRQAERLGQVAAQLKLTPSLYDAATAGVTRQLRKTLPHLTMNPQTHLLQIVPDSKDDAEPFAVTRTLAQAAFDDCCNLEQTQGYSRQFLDPNGAIASAADSALFVQALADTVNEVGDDYRTLLKAFWASAWRGGQTRRDLASGTLHGSISREVHRLRHDGTLNLHLLDALTPLLQSGSPGRATGKALRCHRLAVRVGDGAYQDLACTFVVQVQKGSQQLLLWFSPDHTFVEFADLTTMATYLDTQQGRDRIRPTLALEHQSMLKDAGLFHLRMSEMPGALFADRVKSIIDLQARNLDYALGLSRTPAEAMAMIDDALDVRQLLDPLQLQFSAGRWRAEAPSSFSDAWLSPEAVTSVSAQLTVPTGDGDATAPTAEADTQSVDSPTPASSWLKQTEDFDERAERLRGLDNVLLDYAGHALQPYVSVLMGGGVRASEVEVLWAKGAPVESLPDAAEGASVSAEGAQLSESIDLVSLLLERVSGRRPQKLATDARVSLKPSTASGSTGLGLVDYMLDKVSKGFADHYVERFKASCSESQRQGNRHLQPWRAALSLREGAMRLDLALSKRQEWIDQPSLVLARQVMNRPPRPLREGLTEPACEVFSVSLSAGDSPAATLCDTLILRQPVDQTSAVVLWSCVLGWRQFASIQVLRDSLQKQLHGVERERWLELLGDRDRAPLRNHLLKASDNQVDITLNPIPGHAIEALQQCMLDRKQQDLREFCSQAFGAGFEAPLITRIARAAERDGQLSAMIDALSVRIADSLFEALLPPWVTSAPLVDLMLYNDIWRRYYLASDGGKDFLFDVPLVQDYARKRVTEQLKLDFPGQSLDPDRITVTSRRYATALPALGQLPSAIPAATIVHTQSLTAYAINRFVTDQGTVLSFDSTDQPQAMNVLTTGYLQGLVKRLDIGTAYLKLLRQALNPEDANYALRNRLFVEQLPPTLLALALAEKLKRKLSAKAYEYLSCVVEMPDGIARKPVGETRVILSPMKLVADAGMTPDTVTGVYLICPLDPDNGPLVLYAMFHSPFTFREYASQQALMDDIRTDEALQQLLLERVDPEVHRRYAHGGFVEPHLPFSVGLYDVPIRAPGPVTLDLDEMKGNALQYLFSGTVKLLLDMGVSNSVTNDQADQASRAFLATLGLEQALMLLPGKLAAMVTLWQSQTLFRASAVSASGHLWGKALSEFSAALGVMATAREQALEEAVLEDPISTEPSSTQDDRNAVPSAFSWRRAVLSAEQRRQLQALEARSVALTDMRHDKLLNLYRDRQNTPYAVVDGKVYQVRDVPDEGKWMIVGADGTAGPQLVLGADQRWQLDLGMRLRGGGGVVTKLKSMRVAFNAEDIIVIEATGMPEIRALYRDRARRIGQAHLSARRYLENCLDNLNVHRRGTPLDARVTRIVNDFFGTTTPGQTLLGEVENTIKALYDAIMDDTLSPFSSRRFVVGTTRSGHESVTAFVIKADPKQRVFLTELFFDVPRFSLNSQAAAQGFDASVHYRAANLIHELTHLALDTHDIAYLESMAPYPDLLLGNTSDEIALKVHIERLHTRRFCHRSDRDALFTLREDGQKRDITQADGDGYDFILRHTGASNLNEARNVFLSDSIRRSKVMLGNADSLTLLVLLLGRTRFFVAAP